MNLCDTFDIIVSWGGNMETEYIGKKIRQLRLNDGLTLEQLANSLRIKKNMLSNYELGKSSISVVLLTKIADYFNVSLDFFIGKSVPKLEEPSLSNTKTCDIYMTVYSDDFNDIRNKHEFIHSISLPEFYFDKGEYFGVKITDNSLNLKGIRQGSVALAKKQHVAHQGDVIIYIYGDQKSHYGIFSSTDTNIVISPFSDDYSYTPKIFDILDDNFKIVGKVCMVLGKI